MKQLLNEFQNLSDYRACKQIKFNVGEILFPSMLSILSGSNGFKDMAQWMKSRKTQIQKFLNKRFKVPAYTTIRNVFLNIDIDELNTLFSLYSHKSICSSLDNNKNNKNNSNINSIGLSIIVTDGKTMRGSSDKVRDIKARHILSLFATAENITLAQIQIDEKSNEIPAFIKLIESLNIDNCIITFDAMHTQKKL